MSKILEHYSRKDVQQAILAASRNKEVAIKFGEKGYGSRPDILDFANDIADLAKSGATSFHISEELWHNPLHLRPGMSKRQLDELRKGWDLIIDIDSKHFEIAKKAAILFREALSFHGIKNLSVKFSGNNGFHLGIPAESFPPRFNNIPLAFLFPEAPKLIASYLKQMVKEHLATSLLQQPLEDLLKLSGKSKEELTEKICKRCSHPALAMTSVTLRCNRCSRQEQSFSEPLLVCPDCMLTMQKIKEEIFLHCPRCSTQESLHAQKLFSDGKFNPFSLVDIDTVLISSRHLFRAPYSINEKSGLISLPIHPESIESFTKEQASLKKFIPGPIFLNRSPSEEATLLLSRAYEHAQSSATTATSTSNPEKKQFTQLKAAAQKHHFPPCIQLGLQGLTDGKKRFIFILYNFLSNTGYSHEEIEHLLQEWNKKNPEPLRENYIQAQLSWAKRQKQSIMPPNCNNQSYYPALQICKPDNFCRLIKNPVNYALKSMKMQEQQEQQEKKQQPKEKQKKAPQPRERPIKEKQEKAAKSKKKR